MTDTDPTPPITEREERQNLIDGVRGAALHMLADTKLSWGESAAVVAELTVILAIQAHPRVKADALEALHKLGNEVLDQIFDRWWGGPGHQALLAATFREVN